MKVREKGSEQHLETEMLLSCLKIFWFSKDDFTDHKRRNKKKRDRKRSGKTLLKSIHGWSLPAQERQLKTGLGGKGIDIHCAPTSTERNKSSN